MIEKINELQFKRRISTYCRKYRIPVQNSYAFTVNGIKVTFDEENQYVHCSFYDHLTNHSMNYGFPYTCPATTVNKVGECRVKWNKVLQGYTTPKVNTAQISLSKAIAILMLPLMLLGCSPRYGCPQTSSYTGYHPTTKKVWMKQSKWYPFRRN